MDVIRSAKHIRRTVFAVEMQERSGACSWPSLFRPAEVLAFQPQCEPILFRYNDAGGPQLDLDIVGIPRHTLLHRVVLVVRTLILCLRIGDLWGRPVALQSDWMIRWWLKRKISALYSSYMTFG